MIRYVTFCLRGVAIVTQCRIDIYAIPFMCMYWQSLFGNGGCNITSSQFRSDKRPLTLTPIKICHPTSILPKIFYIYNRICFAMWYNFITLSINILADPEYHKFQSFPRACCDWLKDNGLSYCMTSHPRVLDRSLLSRLSESLGNAFCMCCVLNALHLRYREKSVSTLEFKNCAFIGPITRAKELKGRQTPSRHFRFCVWKIISHEQQPVDLLEVLEAAVWFWSFPVLS
jgi:hypothetical protein